MRSTSRDKENSSATLSTIIDLGITPPPKFIRETRPQLFDKLAIRMAASSPFAGEGRTGREGKGREGPRELLKRYYARHTLSRNQQFQFGLLDLVVRDTLTQLRTERERERGREEGEKREREREQGVQGALVQGSYELLNCFVTVRPSSSFLRFVHPSYSRLPCHRVELCRVVCVRSSSGETTPSSPSLSLSLSPPSLLLPPCYVAGNPRSLSPSLLLPS